MGSNSFVFTHIFAKKVPMSEVGSPPTARRPPTGNPGSASLVTLDDHVTLSIFGLMFCSIFVQVLELKQCIGNLLVSLIEENSPESLIVAKVRIL